MKKAVFTGIINKQTNSDGRVFLMSPPLDGHEFVYVSASTMKGMNVILAGYAGPQLEPETYIFPCDVSGEVTSWGELDGSYRGGLSHAQALKNAGYEIVEHEEV